MKVRKTSHKSKEQKKARDRGREEDFLSKCLKPVHKKKVKREEAENIETATMFNAELKQWSDVCI